MIAMSTVLNTIFAPVFLTSVSISDRNTGKLLFLEMMVADLLAEDEDREFRQELRSLIEKGLSVASHPYQNGVVYVTDKLVYRGSDQIHCDRGARMVHTLELIIREEVDRVSQR